MRDEKTFFAVLSRFALRAFLPRLSSAARLRRIFSFFPVFKDPSVRIYRDICMRRESSGCLARRVVAVLRNNPKAQ